MEFLGFVVKTQGFPCPRHESIYPIKEGMCPLSRQLDVLRAGPDSFGGDKNLPEFKQVWTVPEGSRRLRLPDFVTIGI
jgi:hypothetical protein